MDRSILKNRSKRFKLLVLLYCKTSDRFHCVIFDRSDTDFRTRRRVDRDPSCVCTASVQRGRIDRKAGQNGVRLEVGRIYKILRTHHPYHDTYVWSLEGYTPFIDK